MKIVWGAKGAPNFFLAAAAAAFAKMGVEVSTARRVRETRQRWLFYEYLTQVSKLAHGAQRNTREHM